MIAKRVSALTADDIMTLLDNQVSESWTLDYKRDLPAATDPAKREFLIDISSFANARGGYLVIGIDEVEGSPTDLVGVSPVKQRHRRRDPAPEQHRAGWALTSNAHAGHEGHRDGRRQKGSRD